MKILQNNMCQINRFTLICMFLVGCSYYPNYEGTNINRDHEPADLDQIASYKTDDFISSFFNSPFLLSNMDEEAQTGLTLASVMISDNTGLNRLFKFKTKTVTGYNVEYNTAHPYDGGNITASGLLLVPPSSQPLPLLIYHRASLLTKESAPSLIPGNMLVMDPITDERATMIMLALQGYIVLAPDYTGYGSSDDIRHPYLYKKSVTQTSLDMFFSVTEALKDIGISFKKDVFVMGYSQGAHGAMAFAQGFQNSNRNDFSLKALAAGGGPYDVLETIKELLGQDSINQITTLLFTQSYSYIYNWDLSTILKRDSYEEVIESAFDYEDIAEPADKLPNKASLLFQSQFIEDIQRGNNSSIQKNLEENSVYKWSPSAPVFLFHARNDTIVPYRNMQIASSYFSRNGSSSVTTKDCNFKRFNSFLRTTRLLDRNADINMPEPDHINCIFIFALEASDYLDTL